MLFGWMWKNKGSVKAVGWSSTKTHRWRFFLSVWFHFSGKVFSPERLCSHRPDSSDSCQWILHSNRYRYHAPRLCVFSVMCIFSGGITFRCHVHVLSSDFVLSDEAVDQSDDSPDFYINVCQPLNPIPGVTCPPGAAVCMSPDKGPPVVRDTFFKFIFSLCLFQ